MRNDRFKSAIAVMGAFLLVLAIGTLGWALLRGDPSSATANASWQDAAGGPSGTPTVTPTPDVVVTTPPANTPTPTAVKTSASKKVIPKPTATKKPPAVERPPAPAPVVVDPSCTKPFYVGDAASRDDVKAALVAAAGRQFWQGVSLPADLTIPLPKITVPANLMKAFAYQESGWQSNIMACDGGVGTMQIMPATATQVNSRFGENYDAKTLSGNTSIGAAYIEWLIMYFGLYYFSQNFDLTSVAAVGAGGANLQLLDVVLAAYNVGPGALEVGTNTLSIPSKGQTYANNVKALSTNCECLSW
jgi:hypothetical protein